MVFRVPDATATDLLRLVYKRSSDSQEANVTIPANATGFSMGAACQSTEANSTIGWVVTPQAGGAPISSAKIQCNGATHLDSAIVSGLSEAVHVTLTGDLRNVRQAYLILQPSG